jgi:hypothetical protein
MKLAAFQDVLLFFFQTGHLSEWFHNFLSAVFFCQPSASASKTTA